MKRDACHAFSRRRLITAALIGVAVLVAVVAALYFLGQHLQHSGDAEVYGSLDGRFEDAQPVVWQGRSYVRNNRVHTYLIMGVDQREDVVQYSLGEYRNGGQCDFLMLVAIDAENKRARRIQIDRDTMAQVTVLGILGNDLGTNDLQICLAHSYGDGKGQSCRYAVEAVQRLMYGVKIDGYFSMNMDGIATLNDLLGGVTVTIRDDFSAHDPAMTTGATVTLSGRQAELYVRGRMSIGDGTNASRMLRQQQFLSDAIELASAKVKENNGFIGTLLDGLEDYSVTNISRGKMINEANKAAQYQSESMLTLAGEHTTGDDGFVEYHVDKNALMELVLDVFYEPAA